MYLRVHEEIMKCQDHDFRGHFMYRVSHIEAEFKNVDDSKVLSSDFPDLKTYANVFIVTV